MIRLTKKQVLMLHTQLIESTGGSDDIRDEGLLDSGTSSVNRVLDFKWHCKTYNQYVSKSTASTELTEPKCLWVNVKGW